ncbi:hypothetical protein OG552_20450 [Streptomyces sp. NBC_01476]|uniref:hypothetical protein n=1 Tax=Streptomyces sp. NBC_01476 TaxID=2903881 RepID=UPI002E3560B1|nr:hypothetical protein [Streptomyces sp. NBC_01476]
MFDREYAAGAIESLDSQRRGQVATACLARVAGLLDDDRIVAEFRSVTILVRDIRDYAISRAMGHDEVVPAALSRGIRDFLGPDDDPVEELPGWGAWVMDIASLADYVLRTWGAPEASSKNCFNVLLASYSIAGFLEDEAEGSGVIGLAHGEFQKQMEDLSVALHDGTWANLIEGSQMLSETYLRWFQLVESQ